MIKLQDVSVYFVSAVVIVIAMATILLSHAFSFMKLWEWFAVPAGLPQIRLRTSAAIFIAGMMFHKYELLGKIENWKKVVYVFLMPWITLFSGWLIKVVSF